MTSAETRGVPIAAKFTIYVGFIDTYTCGSGEMRVLRSSKQYPPRFDKPLHYSSGVAASPYTTTLMRIQFLLPWHSIRGYRHRLPPSGGAAAGQPQKASHRGGDAGGSNDEQTGLMASGFASILLPASDKKIASLHEVWTPLCLQSAGAPALISRTSPRQARRSPVRGRSRSQAC